MSTIQNAIRSGQVENFASAAQWLFLGFFVAFAVKVPLFPFHTWLPDAHVEAPTAGSVLLAGVLLKMGTYGMLRFNLGLFPEQARANAWWVMILALIGIIYGALVALVQPNMKKLIAYSSISHLGFVVLGIFSFTQAGLDGATFVMLAHGVSTGALFMLAGMLYERRHTYEISEFGGLASSMPVYASFFLFVVLASVGLPLLNGFIGEFLVLSGAFQDRAVYGVLGATGIIWSAGYLLWMYQRVFYGKITHPVNETLPDLDTPRANCTSARRRGRAGDGRGPAAVAERHRSRRSDGVGAVRAIGQQGGWPVSRRNHPDHTSGRGIRPHSAGNRTFGVRHGIMVLEPLVDERSSQKLLGLIALTGSVAAIGHRSTSRSSRPGILGRGQSGCVQHLFHVLITAITAVVILSSFEYMQVQQIRAGEYYGLILFGAVGMCLMSSAVELVLIFIALEISSISTYVLAGFRRRAASAAKLR